MSWSNPEPAGGAPDPVTDDWVTEFLADFLQGLPADGTGSSFPT